MGNNREVRSEPDFQCSISIPELFGSLQESWLSYKRYMSPTKHIPLCSLDYSSQTDSTRDRNDISQQANKFSHYLGTFLRDVPQFIIPIWESIQV